MRRPGLRLLVGAAALVCAGYLGMLGWLKWHEVELVYRPVTRMSAVPADLGLAPERLQVSASESPARHLLWIYRTQAGRDVPWVVFLHGNAANVSTRVNVERCHQLSLLGLNVVAVEYPGFGESPGHPSEPSMVEAATAAWQWLTTDMQVPPGRVAVYGWSLGSGVATQLSANVAEGALVLEGAFTSVADRAGEVYPFVPVAWLLRHPFDSHSRIAAAGAPVLLLHARDDDIVPFAHGERLLASATGRRQLVPLSGGHIHPNLVSEDDYLQALHTFLSESLGYALAAPPRSLATALLATDVTDQGARAAAITLAREVVSGSRTGYNPARYAVDYAAGRWQEVDAAASAELRAAVGDSTSPP